MSIKTNHSTNEITLGTTTLSVDNNGVLTGTDQASNPINLSGIPIGTIVEAPSAPTDGTWLECDGSTYLRADYPELEGPLPNGLDWTTHTGNVGDFVCHITESNGVLVGNWVSNKTFLTSDFSTYAEVLGIPRLGVVVTFNGSLFSSRGAINYKSVDDGVTWTSHNIATDNPTLTGLASHYRPAVGGAQLFLIPDGYNQNHVLKSTDGTIFTKHVFPVTPSGVQWSYEISPVVVHRNGQYFFNISTTGWWPQINLLLHTRDFTSWNVGNINGMIIGGETWPMPIYSGSSIDDGVVRTDLQDTCDVGPYPNIWAQVMMPHQDICRILTQASNEVGYDNGIKHVIDIPTNSGETFGSGGRQVVVHTVPDNVKDPDLVVTVLSALHYAKADGITIHSLYRTSGDPDWNDLTTRFVILTPNTNKFVVPYQYSHNPGYKFYIKASN